MRWALTAIVIDHLGVSHVIAGLGMSWHTANDAVLTEGHRLLINDETRLNGVRVVGVDAGPRQSPSFFVLARGFVGVG